MVKKFFNVSKNVWKKTFFLTNCSGFSNCFADGVAFASRVAVMVVSFPVATIWTLPDCELS